MKINETGIKGLFLIENTAFADNRGYFQELYHERTFCRQRVGVSSFVQDNISRSRYGVIRGLHFQNEPCAQAKLICALVGEILDVAVDIREGSPTFGKWFSVKLNEDNRTQMFVPRGFAHGFSVLSREAVVLYKCDNFYSKEHESGIIYNDPDLKIDWELPEGSMILSDKDLALPPLRDARINFSHKTS